MKEYKKDMFIREGIVQLLAGEAVRLNALRNPDKIALVFMGRHYTYAELNSRINRLANALTRMGLKKGDMVCILLPNCSEFVEIFYACAKIGVVTNALNTRLAAPEIEYIINDCGAAAIFTDTNLLDTVWKANVGGVRHLIVTDGKSADQFYSYDEIIEKCVEDEPRVELSEMDLLNVIYTSGTTGKPKGACRVHRSFVLLQLLMVMNYDLKETDIGLAAAPLYTAAGFNWALINIFTGATLHILPLPFEPVKVLEAIDKERCTNIFLSPPMVEAILRVPEEIRSRFNMKSLRVVISVGSHLNSKTRESAIKYFGEVVYSVYGSTETAIGYILRPEELLVKPFSSGRPPLGVEVKLLDEKGREVPQGEIGEIAVSSPGVCQGYYNNPDASREIFWGSFIKIGDMGYTDKDGYSYVVDRKQDMILSGAMNVYPAEVEGALKEHPGVDEVAVIGVPDEKWGEAVKALVVLKKGHSLSPGELQEWLRGRIAGYKIPKSVFFVEDLPRNPMGKVMKHLIREKYTNIR